MKKLLIPAALVASLMAATVLPSCKKDENSPSRAELLTGSWKNSEEGDDVNGNGSWDASEHSAVPAAEVATGKFNADGSGTLTGTVNGVPLSIPFTWNLQNSENDLRIIYDFLGKDTTVQKFVSINSTDMILKDESSSPASFVSFKKQ